MTPEEKIADLKANFDYVLEGKDLEIKQLGERCNQLLKDKGDLTDKLAQTIENDEEDYETLKLHDEEEIGMLKSRVEELEQELTVQKDLLQEETNLHLHAEDYIKSLEQQVEKMKCCGNCKFKGCDKSNSYQTCWYCTNKDKWKLGR